MINTEGYDTSGDHKEVGKDRRISQITNFSTKGTKTSRMPCHHHDEVEAARELVDNAAPFLPHITPDPIPNYFAQHKKDLEELFKPTYLEVFLNFSQTILLVLLASVLSFLVARQLPRDWEQRVLAPALPAFLQPDYPELYLPAPQGPITLQYRRRPIDQ